MFSLIESLSSLIFLFDSFIFDDWNLAELKQSLSKLGTTKLLVLGLAALRSLVLPFKCFVFAIESYVLVLTFKSLCLRVKSS